MGRARRPCRATSPSSKQLLEIVPATAAASPLSTRVGSGSTLTPTVGAPADTGPPLFEVLMAKDQGHSPAGGTCPHEAEDLGGHQDPQGLGWG